MKKSILIIAFMFIGMISNAQNYLDKSITEVKKILDTKGYIYEEYVNSGSTYSIRYTNGEEVRTYVFNYIDKCYSYIIQFKDDEKVYLYAKEFAKQGYVLQKNVDDRIKWAFKKGKVTSACLYQEEEDYMYGIIVTIE